MRYTLVIGSRNYSSWSMRAWLLMRLSGVAFEERMVPIYSEGAREMVRTAGGQSGLVPVLVDGDTAIWGTLAIAETLAETSDGIWPIGRAERARARSLSVEMQSNFDAIRRAMPQNLRGRGRVFSHNIEVAHEMRRVDEIFASSRGGWLCGEYSAVDAMFAPLATRFRTYDVTLGGAAADYAESLLAHADVEQWSRAADEEVSWLARFELPVRRRLIVADGARDVRMTPIAFDHVGIRVTDRGRALDFYEKLGFCVDETCSNESVAEMVTSHGVRLNLIFNGVEREDGINVLLDLEEKWTGCTHVAFVVEDLDVVLQWALHNAVSITEGPVDWGRRLTCFLRDPDGNVLEFNELRRDRTGAHSRLAQANAL